MTPPTPHDGDTADPDLAALVSHGDMTLARAAARLQAVAKRWRALGAKRTVIQDEGGTR